MAKRPRTRTSDPTDRQTPAVDPEGRPVSRAKPVERDRNGRFAMPPGRLWDNRLTRANKVYDAWSKDFECQHLDDYYEGKQWRGSTDAEAKGRYVINMVFATVETQLPTLLFSQPKVIVEARPDHAMTDQSAANGRASLIQQTLQTLIDDPKVQFGYETDLALRDAYPRYAVVEVGYSADWIDNPNAGKPILKENSDDPLMDGDGPEATPLREPEKKIKPGTKESVFVRRIPPECFRTYPSVNRLDLNDWSAYYEWHQVSDVKANSAYKNTEDLRGGGVLTMTTEDEQSEADRDDVRKHVGMVKLWKIYDHRKKVRHVHAEGHEKLLQEDKPYEVLPFAVLKFYERKNAFLPVPPIFNWLSPQDEINETREMQKVHRRRAVRRYLADPSVKTEEIEKLETSVDMTVITVAKTAPPPIVPLQDAPLDSQVWTDLAATRDDLNQISGVSGESRNAPDAPTATQANIVNQRATVRESHARLQVANWLSTIARLMLLTVRSRYNQPMMVKRSIDPFAVANQPQQLEQAGALWQQINIEDIEELDVDIKIDVASLSPVASEAKRVSFNNVLHVLSNPAAATWLLTPNPAAPNDPSALCREFLNDNDITSDQKVREWWRVGQAIRQAAQQASAAAASQAKAPEPIKMSLALKGEDLKDPILGPIFMQLIAREEGIKINAAALARTAPPESAVLPNDGGDGGASFTPPDNGAGPTTGTPAAQPGVM